uniref:Uncharacterized protein n=1 Tax=uncultured Armatimonadetes bacterium TaxID=157466 RepID=A0A6J4JZS9_9BACT|nr:hypothetical protein AVDCRST_MAG63-4416 [uncultured Armatimonadetes bacterium]
MRTNNIRFRGCCCGIPFGCGSILALSGGALLLGQAGPGWLLWAGPATLAAVVGALALLGGPRSG